MTISEAKQKLVAWCNAQVGYQEGANNWNKYAPKWTAAGIGWLPRDMVLQSCISAREVSHDRK